MTKRKARASDRERAAELVRAYYSGEPMADDPLGIPVDADRLAAYLASFATLGTFEIPAAALAAHFKEENRELIRQTFHRERDRLKRQGIRNPATRAIDHAMDTWGKSEQTVRDAVFSRKRKP